MHQAGSTVSDPYCFVTIYSEYKLNKSRTESEGLDVPIVSRKKSHENHKKFFKFAAQIAAAQNIEFRGIPPRVVVVGDSECSPSI